MSTGKPKKTGFWLVQVGDWYFSIEAIKAVRIPEGKYGSPFDAQGHIHINAAGNPLVHSLMADSASDGITKDDFKALKTYMTEFLGIDEYMFYRGEQLGDGKVGLKLMAKQLSLEEETESEAVS